MTHEEAIKILELNSICSPKATEFKNAVEIAKNAIEKQILKRPKIKSFPKIMVLNLVVRMAIVEQSCSLIVLVVDIVDRLWIGVMLNDRICLYQRIMS